ncbi:MAG: radical SAM protein [Spirochaetes bacterium]|nr:radical SAM protein [Spirochaetota bacterium]
MINKVSRRQQKISDLLDYRSVDLSVSNSCTNNCLFCANRPDGLAFQPDIKKIKAKMRQAVKQGFRIVEFSAMEPTRNPDIFRLAEFARKLGFSIVHIITNGQSLTDIQFARNLILSGVNKITVSLHSSDKKTEAILTRNKKSFDYKIKALKNLTALKKKYNFILEVTMVLTRYNIGHIPKIVLLCRYMGIRALNVYFPRIHGNAKINFKKVVPRFYLIKKNLIGVSRRLPDRVNINYIDIPPCIFPDNKERERVGIRLRKRIVRPSEKSEKLIQQNDDVRQVKIKGERCRDCFYFNECEGVFREYVDAYGWREFTPVQSS